MLSNLKKNQHLLWIWIETVNLKTALLEVYVNVDNNIL